MHTPAHTHAHARTYSWPLGNSKVVACVRETLLTLPLSTSAHLSPSLLIPLLYLSTTSVQLLSLSPSPSLPLCFLLSAHCVLTPLKHFQVSLKYLFNFLGICRKFLGNRSPHPLAPLAQSITNNKSIYLVYVAPGCLAPSSHPHWQSHLSSSCCRFYSCQCAIALNLHWSLLKLEVPQTNRNWPQPQVYLYTPSPVDPPPQYIPQSTTLAFSACLS